MAKSNVFKVSQSKVKLFRKCHYAYHLRYKEKLRRKRKSRPLQFGSMVHEMLEAHANGNDPFKVLKKIGIENQKLFRGEREMYGEIVDDIRVIMTEYFEHWGNSLRYIPIGGKKAEHEFEIDLVDGIIATGKIDAKAKSKNGLRWLVEHKTFNQMMSEDHRWRNIQSSIYIRVNDILGWKPVDGTLWDNIRSKPPSKPKLLKSGQMSKRGIDSLPLRIVETLKEQGLSPRKFQSMIDQAAQNRTRYFQRQFTTVKKGVVDLVFKDFVASAVQMSENTSTVKCIDRHCDYCDFEPICRAELQGLDVDYIKEREYYVHEKDDYEEKLTGE